MGRKGSERSLPCRKLLKTEGFEGVSCCIATHDFGYAIIFFMKQNNKNRGFSVIELALVIGIIVVIGAFTLPNLLGRKSVTELNNTVNQMSITLREAQSRAISQSGGSEWGVRFDNGNPPYFAMFSTPSYNTSTRVIYTTLPKGIGYVTSTLLAGASTTVVFSQITGKPTQSITLGLYPIVKGQPIITVSVALSGQIALIGPGEPITAAAVAAVAQHIQSIAAAAQQNSINQVDEHDWGINFDNTNPSQPRYALYHIEEVESEVCFKGVCSSLYSTSTVVDSYYSIPIGVEFTPPELPVGTGASVLFNSSGIPSPAYEVGVRSIAVPATSGYVQIQSDGGICNKNANREIISCSELAASD